MSPEVDARECGGSETHTEMAGSAEREDSAETDGLDKVSVSRTGTTAKIPEPHAKMGKRREGRPDRAGEAGAGVWETDTGVDEEAVAEAEPSSSPETDAGPDEEDEQAAETVESDAREVPETETETGTGTQGETEGETEAVTEAEAETGTEIVAETGTDTGAEAEAETGADMAEADIETEGERTGEEVTRSEFCSEPLALARVEPDPDARVRSCVGPFTQRDGSVTSLAGGPSDACACGHSEESTQHDASSSASGSMSGSDGGSGAEGAIL